ncbi:MAG: S8 family peptidase [Bacteroidales bacterium]|jgi:hypothetical protein|nr:S8 family peptidase [Bacteroidales bacterium]
MDYSDGYGVKVAVVDQGIQLNHPDLAANIYPYSYDCQTGTSPSNVYGYHGSHVAGTVAAVGNNNLQVVGVAYGSQLMSVSNSLLVRQPNVSEKLADGINWAWQNGADIINNSWGASVNSGEPYDSLQSIMLEDAISDALYLGRNGKGTIVVFASGNDYENQVTYPACYMPYLTVVGAIQQNGERAIFSNYGKKLDVVAPGVDILSTNEYSGTMTMSGTSMAAPHVAGVAALILSVNPNLTRLQVNNIIEVTAQKIRPDLYRYDDGDPYNYPNGPWDSLVGYGLVNAYEAVLLANCWDPGYDIVSTTTITNNTTWNTPTMVTGVVTVAAGVTLNINNTNIKFLQDAGIVVKATGQLLIDGSYLTSCDSMWNGIVVEGDGNRPRDAAYQGVVIMSNSTLENAVCAIATVGQSSTAYSGAIVEAKNSAFANNGCAVRFAPYSYGSYNLLTFDRCKFYMDNNYIGTNDGVNTGMHVKINHNKNIQFLGCDFNNADATLAWRGIQSEDAHYIVDDYCSVSYSGCFCPDQYAQPSHFTGLLLGIEAYTAGFPTSFYVNHAIFDGNSSGAMVSGINNFEIIQSTFNTYPFVQSSIGYYCGILSRNCTGYHIEANRFTTENLNRYSGMLIFDSGTADNLIYRNSFSDMENGVFISGQNGTDIGSNDHGLQCFCNYFGKNYYDIFLQESATIKIKQGIPSQGADNEFYYTVINSIYSGGPQYITYHFSDGIYFTPVFPTLTYVSLAPNATPNDCVPTVCASADMLADVDTYITLQEQYDVLAEEWKNSGYQEILLNVAPYSPELIAAALQIQNQMDAISNTMRKIADANISKLLNEPVDNLNELQKWYSIIRTPIAKYLLAEVYFQLGDVNNAEATLSLIPTMFNFSDFEMEEHHNYLRFKDLKINVQISSRTWEELTEAEIAELQTLATATHGRSASMAQGVLCFFYGICEDYNGMEERKLQYSNSNLKPQSTNAADNVFLFPNPTSGSIELSSGENEMTHIAIYDLVGRPIFSKEINSTHTKLDIANLEKGVYLIRIYLNNNHIINKKVIKQ